MGIASSSGDSGVSNRVFAQIAQFMGNTELRGKVIWFLLTCRPDLLPVDLKRQGRAEEHIALFYPHTDEERLAMLRAMHEEDRHQAGIAGSGELFPEAFRRTLGRRHRSHTDARPDEECAGESGRARGLKILKSALEDFIPPSYPTEIELQTLAGGAGMHQPELAPRGIPRDGSRGGRAPGQRTGVVEPGIASRN